MAGLSQGDRPRRCLPVRTVGAAARGTRGWLINAHGGAGASTLLRAGLAGAAVDADRFWPVDQHGAQLEAVLVCRSNAAGLSVVRDLAFQLAYAAPELKGRLHIAGLVVVADAAGSPPAPVRQLLTLVGSAFEQVWTVPWVEPWRAAGTDEPLNVPRPVQRVLRQISAALPARHPAFAG